MVCATPRPGMMVTFGRAGRSVCLGIAGSSQYELRHRFNVIRLWKDVDGLNATEPVSRGHEMARISRQCGGIARDVDDATRLQRRDCSHDLRGARAWRVEHDQIGCETWQVR